MQRQYYFPDYRNENRETAVAEDLSKSKSFDQKTLKNQKITTMKTMNNFAAQQLTKKAMNEVKGGTVVHCEWIGADGFPREAQGRGDTLAQATMHVFQQIPAGVNADCRTI